MLFRGLKMLAAATALAACLPPGPAAAADLVIFAAASLKNALDAVAAAWTEASGEAASISYAGSSTLAKQIEEGAPADVFISADLDWMDYLATRNLVDPATRRTLLGNRLVLIASGTEAAPVEIASGFDLAGMLGAGRLAIADVKAVPAGRYGKAALESLGVWASVETRLAEAENVRAALAFVALGEAPLGIVYATDAGAEDDVTIVGTFPESSHPAILYPAAVTADSAHPQAAAFLDFLGSAAARAAFEAEGFTVVEPADAGADAG
ncbi:MAG: molybdate ABC transporter substrate-binding protein [Rhodobacteraceae bacterium]|nr:molybdate ABC transporter substrate-binding protein [Paracoccaceae bacterium]